MKRMKLITVLQKDLDLARSINVSCNYEETNKGALFPTGRDRLHNFTKKSNGTIEVEYFIPCKFPRRILLGSIWSTEKILGYRSKPKSKKPLDGPKYRKNWKWTLNNTIKYCDNYKKVPGCGELFFVWYNRSRYVGILLTFKITASEAKRFDKLKNAREFAKKLPRMQQLQIT